MSPRGLGSSCATLQPLTLQPLTRQELERRIHKVITEVSNPVEQDPRGRGGDEDFRWIAAADLVRRMRPHLVFN